MDFHGFSWATGPESHKTDLKRTQIDSNVMKGAPTAAHCLREELGLLDEHVLIAVEARHLLNPLRLRLGGS